MCERINPAACRHVVLSAFRHRCCIYKLFKNEKNKERKKNWLVCLFANYELDEYSKSTIFIEKDMNLSLDIRWYTNCCSLCNSLAHWQISYKLEGLITNYRAIVSVALTLICYVQKNWIVAPRSNRKVECVKNCHLQGNFLLIVSSKHLE